jgi:hypothetical protein
MKKVLIRTLVFTLIAVFVAGLVYNSMTGRLDRKIVFIIGVLALSAAIPFTFGYILANISLRSSNSILTAAKFILLLVNGGLIIGAIILTIAIAYEDMVVYVSFPFILAGSYTYNETIKLIRQDPKLKNKGQSESDILDDLFIDEE